MLIVSVGEPMRCLDIQVIPENSSPNQDPLEAFLEISTRPINIRGLIIVAWLTLLVYLTSGMSRNHPYFITLSVYARVQTSI